MGLVRLKRRGARRVSVKRRRSFTPFKRSPIQSRSVVPRNPTLSSVPAVNGFPEVYRTTLRYCDNIQFTEGGGSTVQQIMRMNSCFDPDLTGVGHQPLYYDQLTPIYSRYRVLYSKLTVTFLPITTPSTGPVIGPWQVALVGNATGTFPTSASSICEQNRSYSKLLSRDWSATPTVLSITYMPARDLGVPPDDDTVAASTGGNPAAPYFVCIQSNDLNSTGGIIQAKLTMEFDVEFFAQSNIAPS